MQKFSPIKSLGRGVPLSVLLIVCFESQITAANPLALREFLTQVVPLDPELKLVLATTEQQSYVGYTQVPSSQAQWSHESKLDTDSKGEKRILELGNSVTKDFLSLGSRVALSHRYLHSDSSGEEDQKLSLRYDQRLLRGRFGHAHHKIEKSGQLERDIHLVDSHLQYQQRVKDIALHFLDLQHLKIVLANKRSQLQIAKSLLDLVRKKKARAIASSLDLAQSEQQVLLREIDVEEARTRLEKELGSIERIMRVSSVSIALSSDLAVKKVLTIVDRKKALKLDRSSKRFRVQRQQYQLAQEQLDENALGDVSVFAGIDSLASKDNVKKPEARGVFGLNVSLKFGHDSQLEARRREIAFQSSELRMQEEKYLFDRAQQLSKLRLDLAQDESLMTLARKRLKLAARIVVQEKNRYDLGRSDLANLLRAQDSQSSAALGLEQYRLSFKKNYVNWLAKSDELTKEFTVKEELFVID